MAAMASWPARISGQSLIDLLFVVSVIRVGSDS